MQKYILIALWSISMFSCTVTRPLNKENQALLTREIDEIYHQKNFNGFAVAIVDEHGILYKKGFGFSDVSTNRRYTEKTIQNIASVSKTLTGIALLKAEELGQLRLDDPIDKYLPFDVINPNFPREKITIRQLATHTSSIADNEYYLSKNYFLKSKQDLQGIKPGFEEEQVFNPSDSLISMQYYLENVLSKHGKWNQGTFLNNKPGTIYEYSNTGTALAAFIIEQATGKPYTEFTKEYILKPLKMDASGWKFDDIRFADFSRLYENASAKVPYYECATYPDGGFITSVNDLSKFLIELIRGYNGEGTLLTRKSYDEYFRPQLSAANFIERNERNPYSESYNTGIFIGFGYTGYIGHTGGDPGVISIMFFNPETNIGRIMIFNTGFSDKAGNDAFYAIWNALEKYQDKLKK